jgi:hydrogenase nickel incorporation protein HypB
MMKKVRLIEIKEVILSDNKNLADEIRSALRAKKVFMLNLMSSPGAGKTSLILNTIRTLKKELRIGVIEGDIDSMVDSEKVAQEGVPAVQIRTGDACHLDAPMIDMALRQTDLENIDFLIIENVGNLVCPAEFDTGATKRAMILSIPEGDDKPLKYPLMFSVCDVVVINKMDYIDLSDFDLKAFTERVRTLNPQVKIFQVSCKTGDGIDAWIDWLRGEIAAFRST